VISMQGFQRGSSEGLVCAVRKGGSSDGTIFYFQEGSNRRISGVFEGSFGCDTLEFGSVEARKAVGLDHDPRAKVVIGHPLLSGQQ